MPTNSTRRRFIVDLGALAASSLFAGSSSGATSANASSRASLAAANIRFGCAAITWGNDIPQALTDISALGYAGVQLRANAFTEYGARTAELRAMLKQRRLEMVALSSGTVGITPGTETEEIAKHARHAAFVRDLGGKYLQLIDNASPKDRQPIADDYKRLGNVMNEIGKRTADAGVPAAYHPHMNTLGEAPDQIERILSATDPRYVKLLLDVAHYTQGGGDPVRAIKQYRDRLLFLHLKDVQSPVPPDATTRRSAGDNLKPSYRFVQLGRGKVNLPAVFAALEEINFKGWAIVELDAIPDNAGSPKEAADASRRYIEETLKLRVRPR